MKEGTRLLTFLALLLLFAGIGFLFGSRSVRNEPESTIIRDTVTCTIIDTIVREKPIYKYSYVHDTVRTWFTTIQHDTVQVDIPIEHKIYEEDSLYRCEISGFMPKLESLTIYPTTTTITIHEKEKIAPPRFGFGAAIGPSVLATPTGSVHAGLGATIGLTYRF